jgi:hypothetical protein
MPGNAKALTPLIDNPKQHHGDLDEQRDGEILPAGENGASAASVAPSRDGPTVTCALLYAWLSGVSCSFRTLQAGSKATWSGLNEKRR